MSMHLQQTQNESLLLSQLMAAVICFHQCLFLRIQQMGGTQVVDSSLISMVVTTVAKKGLDG
jgi:hypothetical protein